MLCAFFFCLHLFIIVNRLYLCSTFVSNLAFFFLILYSSEFGWIFLCKIYVCMCMVVVVGTMFVNNEDRRKKRYALIQQWKMCLSVDILYTLHFARMDGWCVCGENGLNECLRIV